MPRQEFARLRLQCPFIDDVPHHHPSWVYKADSDGFSILTLFLYRSNGHV